LDATIDILTKTPPSQRGKKLPGPGREGWYRRLSKLPAVVLSNSPLGLYIHELMEAERKGIFAFETRRCTDTADPALHRMAAGRSPLAIRAPVAGRHR